MKFEEFRKLTYGNKVKFNGNTYYVVRTNRLTSQALLECKSERLWVEFYKIERA